MRKRIVRITTVPESLKTLLKGQLRFINETGKFEVIGVSSPGKYLDEVTKFEGIECYSVTMTRKINPFSDIIAIFKLSFLLRKIKPDIVHTHTPKAGVIGMISAFMAGVPVRLHTVAGLPLMEYSGWLRRILFLVEKLTYSFSTLVLPNSFGLLRFMADENLLSEGKMKVIGYGSSNGINLDYYKITDELLRESENIKAKFGITESDRVFLFIGRVVSHKGVNELLRAFDDLQNEYGNAKLLIVGDYEEHLDPLKPESKDLMNKRNIIHAGFQVDVRPWFILADVFVFPSYREGFPNVVLQACAYNLPCIVTDINGCNEIISDRINGLLIPKKDYMSIYRAMKGFMIDSYAMSKKVIRSRDTIAERFDQKIFWTKVLDLYESLV